MAAENLAPPALPLPLPLPPISTASRPDRDSLTAPSPPVLTAPVGPGAPPVASAPHHQPYDPSLDPAIKQLLDQQAEIQARLAALLPQKYGPNIKLELEMLRHKLRVLRAYADENRELPSVLPRHVSSIRPVWLCPPSQPPNLIPSTRIIRKRPALVRDRGGESAAVSVRVHRNGLC
jgi:hypothetical protein